MIEKFKLKFGRVPGIPSQDISVTPVTVFVGPNNSGKSKVLSEIEKYCQSGNSNNLLILDNLIFSSLSEQKVHQAIERVQQ
jgi:predicted ATPase